MIGEADGRRKYESDAQRDGRRPRDVLWAEKLRARIHAAALR